MAVPTIRGRSLHFVFKITNRNDTINFYKNILGMKVLRHEEFQEGCKASCNGPFDGKWSKTMIGYGPESGNFAIELTYNYGMKSYQRGNDFVGLVVKSRNASRNIVKSEYPFETEKRLKIVKTPDEQRFYVDESGSLDIIVRVILSCSHLKRSLDYWHGCLNMKIFEKEEKRAVLGYDENQCKLELRDIEQPIVHAEGYGRIAFSCTTNELPNIQAKVKEAGYPILTPLVGLDTPGKATVHVVILADPDGHEICFVGDESFRELSKVDPRAEKLLGEAIKGDFSDDFYAQKLIEKAQKANKR